MDIDDFETTVGVYTSIKDIIDPHLVEKNGSAENKQYRNLQKMAIPNRLDNY